jgi:hypothetical protein
MKGECKQKNDFEQFDSLLGSTMISVAHDVRAEFAT